MADVAMCEAKVGFTVLSTGLSESCLRFSAKMTSRFSGAGSNRPEKATGQLGRSFLPQTNMLRPVLSVDAGICDTKLNPLAD